MIDLDLESFDFDLSIALFVHEYFYGSLFCTKCKPRQIFTFR